MLALNDPRWLTLRAGGGSNGQMVAQLLQAVSVSTQADDALWAELFHQVCHQQTVSSAAYAAVPHLVAIAAALPASQRLHSLSCVGAVCAAAGLPYAAALPEDLRSDYKQALVEALRLTAEALGVAGWDQDALRLLLSTLAALHGQPELAFITQHFDGSLSCPACGHIIDLLSTELNPYAPST